MKSRSKAYGAQLDRLIRRCRSLGPWTAARIAQCFNRADEAQTLNGEIRACLQRIGQPVSDLLIEFKSVYFVSYVQVVGDRGISWGPDEYHSGAIRSAARLLIQAKRRLKASQASTVVAEKDDEPESVGAPLRKFDRSIGTQKSVEACQSYMDDRGLNQAEFATLCGIDPRTLREFFKTNKLRRSVFQTMAKRMNLSCSQLLNGQLREKV